MKPVNFVAIGVLAMAQAIAGDVKPAVKPHPAKPVHTAPAETPAARPEDVRVPAPKTQPGQSNRSHTALGEASNRGQVVSACNHNANERELTGHDRQDYVEWCTSRGHRYDRDYTDRYWNDDRRCYGQADDRSLTGDRRAKYLADCLQRDDDRRYPDR